MINLITMSDVAYAKALILNSHEIWKKELEVREKMAENSGDGGRVKKKLTKTIRKQFLGRDPAIAEYTCRKGVTRKYMGHGWNKTGITMYKKLRRQSLNYTKNKVLWEKMGCAWEAYVIDT